MSTMEGFGETTPCPFIGKTDWNLFQHRVDFKPDEERTFLRKMHVRDVDEQLPKYIFDGSIMFTTQPLNNDKCPVVLTTRRKYDDTLVQITIKEVDEVLSTDHRHEQFVNNVMRQCTEKLNLQLLGRDYYDKMLKDFTSIRQTHDNNPLCCEHVDGDEKGEKNELEDEKAVEGCSSKRTKKN